MTTRFTLALLLLLAASAHAAAPVEGRDYQLLKSAPAATAKQITVVDYFSFNCGPCKGNAPLLAAWRAKLPADVQLTRVIVPLEVQISKEPGNRTYQALQHMGKQGQLDAALFRAIQEQGKRFDNLQTFVDWLATQGVAREAFKTAYDSFRVAIQERQAQDLLAPLMRHEHSAVPAMTINGRYLVHLGNSRDVGANLAVVDHLIARARAEISATK